MIVRERYSVRGNRHIYEALYKSKEEAESALYLLNYFIEKYGHASVVDLYDLNNERDTHYQFNDAYYGWTDVDKAEIKEVTEGYKLILPVAKRFD